MIRMRGQVVFFLAVLAATSCAHRVSQAPARQPASPRPVYVANNAPRDAPLAAAGDTGVMRYVALVEPCRLKARAAFPAARRRYVDGLPAGQTFFVKTRLRDSAGHIEDAFVAVDRAEVGRLTGRVWSQVLLVAGYQYGQSLSVADDEVIDWLISRPDGTEEGNWMGQLIDALGAGRPTAGICSS